MFSLPSRKHLKFSKLKGGIPFECSDILQPRVPGRVQKVTSGYSAMSKYSLAVILKFHKRLLVNLEDFKNF